MTSIARLTFYWPIATLSIFYLFCLFTTIKLGYMPSYGKPDPKLLYSGMILLLIYCSFFLSAISLAFYCPWVIWKKRARQRIHYALLLLVFVSALYFDPFGQVEWILD